MSKSIFGCKMLILTISHSIVKICLSKTSDWSARYTQTFRYLIRAYPDMFQEAKDQDSSDVLIEFANSYSHLYKIDANNYHKTIVFLQARIQERPLMKSGFYVDEPQLQGIYNVKKILDECLLVFTNLDFNPKESNYCFIPFSFNYYKNISQEKNYWQKGLMQEHKTNRVYWSGSVWTHSSRNITKQLMDYEDSRYVLKEWKPKTSSGEEARVYGLNKPDPSEYQRYISNLSASQITLVIRGDRPWLFSFLDVLRAGTIPVFIDTLYPELGWENLDILFSDIGLQFNSAIDSVECIKSQIDELLDDNTRMNHMKGKINHFYSKHIKNDILYKKGVYDSYWTGWLNFYGAKIYSVYHGFSSDMSLLSRELLM